jgi:ABC-type Na+ transport system ATPase subunit NatA
MDIPCNGAGATIDRFLRFIAELLFLSNGKVGFCKMELAKYIVSNYA